jgi:hypothetical protein
MRNNINQRGFVLPLVIAIVAILAIGGAYWYVKTSYFPPHPIIRYDQFNGVNATPNVSVQNATTTVNTEDWKTYSDINFSFNYPPIISVKKDGEKIFLNHSIDYKHASPCDFKGDSKALDKFYDFGVSFEVLDGGIEQSKKNSFVWSYEEIKIGNLNGFVGESGIEGCGQYTYLFSISETKTLIISSAYVPEFNSINMDFKKYLDLPGIIKPDQADRIFKDILSSIKFTTISPNAVNPVSEMDLALYIQDKTQVEKISCSITKKVIYKVPKTSAVADASLKILFDGELSKYGVYKSVSIVQGVAKVLLESENTPGGQPIGSLTSCQSSHLLAVLKDTLTQYPTIKSVELYSPNGPIIF